LKDVPSQPAGWTITALSVGAEARANLAIEDTEPPHIDTAIWRAADAGTLV
jgi:hypothetical protein